MTLTRCAPYWTMTDSRREGGGLSSLDAALEVLRAMAKRSGPVSLSDLARECSMPVSKVHRYLASFLVAGMVTQAGKSGKYDLGPGAVKLGLAAIGRNDFVNHAADGLHELADATGMSALLSVWGDRGATVVRWERAATPTVTSMGLGTVMPLLGSATGRAFLAWAPRAPLTGLLNDELAQAQETTSDEVDALVKDIRRKGFASVEGLFIPGLVAMAAPILDWQDEAQAVVTLIGTDPRSIRESAQESVELVDYCRSISISSGD
ncbi:IclR family transcriptional regulator [Lutimaribacter marinistellae]|uniref:IclR family transcriptional regulator n=1 Tax=Lutimaribacter marinistellae TaxID=1820329 RepID=A0ABV7TIF2_9RHOB